MLIFNIYLLLHVEGQCCADWRCSSYVPI